MNEIEPFVDRPRRLVRAERAGVAGTEGARKRHPVGSVCHRRHEGLVARATRKPVCPLGRLGEPNEIVGLALYFASSAATSRHEVVAEVGEVDDSVGAGAAVVVAGDRVAVGEEGERSTGFRVHESELARGTTVSER